MYANEHIIMHVMPILMPRLHDYAYGYARYAYYAACYAYCNDVMHAVLPVAPMMPFNMPIVQYST